MHGTGHDVTMHWWRSSDDSISGACADSPRESTRESIAGVNDRSQQSESPTRVTSAVAHPVTRSAMTRGGRSSSDRRHGEPTTRWPPEDSVVRPALSGKPRSPCHCARRRAGRGATRLVVTCCQPHLGNLMAAAAAAMAAAAAAASVSSLNSSTVPQQPISTDRGGQHDSQHGEQHGSQRPQ